MKQAASPISQYSKLVSESNFDMISEKNVKLYPNCDGSVWLRNCEEEVIKPIGGVTKGNIPKWLNGSLLRNGPGNLKVGNMKFDHLFDSEALLHKFAINNGKVTYQCRFVRSNCYEKNHVANRIVVTAYGTKSVPDPCHTIFQRISSLFCPDDELDNTNISIYPVGDEFFTFTEFPTIHRINIQTLETEGKVNVSKHVGVINHTSHPFVMPDKTVFNIGLSVSPPNETHYNIICFPNGDKTFENAYIVSKIPARWRFHPSYMHSFGITKNYFIIIEQPLSLSLLNSIKAKFLRKPLASIFKWYQDECTVFYVISRRTGELKFTFKTTEFFYLHVINAYETSEYIVIDICCYKDASMLDCMYVEAIENMQRIPNYSNMFKARPLRFVLPLRNLTSVKITRRLNICDVWSAYKKSATSAKLMKTLKKFKNIENVFNKSNCDLIKNSPNEIDILGKNLIGLKGSQAEAYQLPDSTVYCVPEMLCDVGCETPRINDRVKLGRNYRFFYAISSDVDTLNPGAIIKVDVKTKTKQIWYEHNCYPSEPIFVPAPNAKSEDDGVVLSAIIWGGTHLNRVGLLILCAKTFTELGRCEFTTPGPVPKCLHGWYVPT